MDYRCSIDNLTLVGYCSKYVLNDLENNPLIERMWTTPTSIYHYNFKCVGGAFIQLKHETQWQPIFPKDGDTRRNSAKPMRFEFNPNQYKGSGEIYIINIIKKMFDVHITRKDVAIDIFDIDMNDFLILDKRSRKQREYRQSNGTMETLYMGSSESDEQVRIYNKAIEKKIQNDVKWWRIEAQMRGDRANTNFYNPFESVIISRKTNFMEYPLKERAILVYLQANPSAMKELSKPSRTKYKKMLIEKADTFEIDLNQVFFESMFDLAREMDEWLTFTELRQKGNDPIRPLKTIGRDFLTDEEKEYYKNLAEKIKIKGENK